MKNSLSLFVLGAAVSAVTSLAQAASPEAVLIESIRCVDGRGNIELIQEQVGNVGSLTTLAYIESLAIKMNGPEVGARSYAESTSKKIVLLSVDGSDEGLCRNGGQRTDLVVVLKK